MISPLAFVCFGCALQKVADSIAEKQIGNIRERIIMDHLTCCQSKLTSNLKQ
jgi:hypothetical protein